MKNTKTEEGSEREIKAERGKGGGRERENWNER